MYICTKTCYNHRRETTQSLFEDLSPLNLAHCRARCAPNETKLVPFCSPPVALRSGKPASREQQAEQNDEFCTEEAIFRWPCET
jgi:hypothetical protein